MPHLYLHLPLGHGIYSAHASPGTSGLKKKNHCQWGPRIQVTYDLTFTIVKNVYIIHIDIYMHLCMCAFIYYLYVFIT